MPLTLKAHPSMMGVTPMDGYIVRSGGLVAGYMNLQAFAGSEKAWVWSISLSLTSGYDGVTSGRYADLDEAKKQFRQAWLAFLPFIGLREID